MGNTRALQYYDGNNQPFQGGDYKHINTTTTNTAADAIYCQIGEAILWRIVVNQAGSADWTVAVYDAAQSSDIVAANEIAVGDVNSGGNFEFEAVCKRGIAILTYFTGAGTSPGDITVVSSGV